MYFERNVPCALLLLVFFVIPENRKVGIVADAKESLFTIQGQEASDPKFLKSKSIEHNVRFEDSIEVGGRKLSVQGVRICEGLSVAVIFSETDDLESDLELSDDVEEMAGIMIQGLISKRRLAIDSSTIELKGLRSQIGATATRKFIKNLRDPALNPKKLEKNSN